MAKWTIETKTKAIEMLKDGVDIERICEMSGMSRSSVVSVKYSKDVYGSNDERIECKICGKTFKQLTKKHLDHHNITLDDYKAAYPSSPTMNNKRQSKYRSFKNPNKGKTYREIYGEKEALLKKNKISKHQIGRECPRLAGTGITGTRRDTNTFARSTYEANIDRIFIFNNKRYIDELSEENKRFILKCKDGGTSSYQPDRIDVDGLFGEGAYLEIKGYMYPEDWEKIVLFREQYPSIKLIVIGPDDDYCDINYNDLVSNYKDRITLWEDSKNNYKTRPDLYKIGYQTPDHIFYLQTNYPEHINIDIDRSDIHKIFIAQKCLAYNRVCLGKDPYIQSVQIEAITNKRFGSLRRSCGKYNYELWRVEDIDGGVFYVTNQSKTVLFYCYKSEDYPKIRKFFEGNCNMGLTYGKK